MSRKGHGGAEKPDQQGKPAQWDGSERYRMRQKLVSIGDDYWIENAQGQRVFFVDGKAFRLREHLSFIDMQGNELVSIQEKVMHIKDTYSIYRNDNVFATVKKALVTPLRQRFDVHVAGAENMEVEGNIVDHEYAIHEGRKRMAEVSKKWFHVEDTYGVDIIPGTNDILILAITVVIDMMIDSGR
ncbi:MAG TPA: LURP-one-related family protein [Ktedonobacteraceae bacterium]|nr:LURP-one-related family protein [Ktedonobacteraceae bacterium]